MPKPRKPKPKRVALQPAAKPKPRRVVLQPGGIPARGVRSALTDGQRSYKAALDLLASRAQAMDQRFGEIAF